MKDDKLEYDIQKRARAGTAATARAVVALYVAWLGVKVIRGVAAGDSTLPPAVGWIAGIIFIAAAAVFCLYSWKRWRADVEAARIRTDPDAEEKDAEASNT